MTEAEKLEEVITALELIAPMISDFHTMKHLRVWASEENREIKLAVTKIISETLSKVAK